MNITCIDVIGSEIDTAVFAYMRNKIPIRIVDRICNLQTLNVFG